VKVSSFGSAFSGLSCSASIFIDDVLNGNVTSSGTEFFTGLNTLSNQLNNLNASLANINTNMTDLTINTPASSQSLTALNNIQGSKLKVQQIPHATSFELEPMYPSDLTTASVPPPPYTVDSMFKSVLGKYDNASSLVGGLYTVLDKIEIMISQARNNGATFSSSYTSVDTTLGTIRSSIDSISSSITKMDSSIGGPVGLMKTIGTSGNMGLQAFYGVFIGFGSLALLGTLLTACCNKFGCRHLIYFSCLIMFLVGLLGALISTIFSIFIPVFTWGCSFLDVTFLDQVGFKGNYRFMQLTWALL